MNREIGALLRGLVKVILFCVGLAVWLVPIILMGIYVVLLEAGGISRSIDEYKFGSWWLRIGEQGKEELWKW